MDDKNQIKNMLETHQKQYSLGVLIISIVVALFIGIAVGYGIKTFIEATKNAYNQTISEKNYNAPYLNEENNTVQNEQPTEEKNSVGNYTVNVNNTQPSNAINSSLNTQDNISTAYNESGPEIISPEVNENSSRKTETKWVNKTHTQKTLVTHSKLKHHIHKHTSIKRKSNLAKYVIQVSSNLNRKVALSTLAKLRRYGFKAYIVCVNIHNKTYSRIMVGPIIGHRAAISQSNKIKRKLRLVYSPLIKKDD